MNNVAASVRTRLLSVAKAQGVDFNQVLVRFALERIQLQYAYVRQLGSVGRRQRSTLKHTTNRLQLLVITAKVAPWAVARAVTVSDFRPSQTRPPS